MNAGRNTVTPPHPPVNTTQDELGEVGAHSSSKSAKGIPAANTYLVPQQNELVPTSTLFGTDNPGEALAQMTKVAATLADVVRKQNLVVRIQQSEHVRVEGWTFLGSLLGVFPVVEWTRPVLEDERTVGWEARVEARTRAGEIVGAAEAECLRSERSWGGRDDYALRSMAQTRAVSKALRLPLGFVMQLAGFNPTPAEEMAVVEHSSLVGEPTAAVDDSASSSVSPAAAPTAEPASPTKEIAQAVEGLPVADMADPDIPFGDAPLAGLPITGPQKKKLNVLIGKLRPAHISTLQLWQSMGREPVPSDDGELHWSPLRDSLSKAEASELIERLESYAADVLPL